MDGRPKFNVPSTNLADFVDGTDYLVPRAGARGLVAIEGFVYQVVELNHQCIQIMSGECDQMRPSFPECDQKRPNNLSSRVGPQFCGPQFCGLKRMRYICKGGGPECNDRDGRSCNGAESGERV